MRQIRHLLLGAALATVPLSAAGYEVVPRPKKGSPYPGSPQTIPYEDVIDHCDLILAGKVTALRFDRVELEVAAVLRGKFKQKAAAISFKGQWRGDATERPKVGESAAFLCLRDEKGGLLLAGNPPKGGGFMQEGAEFARKLLKAAKDPAKGYKSDEFVVRFSSAYRLARSWLESPAGKKPKLPARVVDTLCGGLIPGEDCRRHSNAAARNAINRMLRCDVFRIAKYSVNRPEAKRTAAADRVDKIWLQTVKAVRYRRRKRSSAAKVKRATVRKLIDEFTGEDAAAAKAARTRLLELKRAALGEVGTAAGGKDPKRAAACRGLLAELKKAVEKEMDIFGYTFNLDRAELFVPPGDGAAGTGPGG